MTKVSLVMIIIGSVMGVPPWGFIGTLGLLIQGCGVGILIDILVHTIVETSSRCDKGAENV